MIFQKLITMQHFQLLDIKMVKKSILKKVTLVDRR